MTGRRGMARLWKGEGGDMKAGDGEAVEGWGNGRQREMT